MWKQLGIVITVALLSLFLFWLPFLFHARTFWGITFPAHGMETIVANFDGLNYLAIAKTGYNPLLLSQNFAGFGNPPIYYAAHFPLFPGLIALFGLIVSGPQALELVIIMSNILLAIGLYAFFVTMTKQPKLATILSCIALFFPARMLSVRGVGSSEPLFMFFVLTSLAAAYRGKHWLSAILGSFAVMTRSPGIFLFGAYLLSALASYTTDIRKIIAKIYPYLLMPLALILVFGLYRVQFGDFWAYFHGSSELHPVFFPPLLIFSNMQKWITEMWREDIVYLYLVYGTGIFLFVKKVGTKCGFEQLATAAYGVLSGLILLLIAHRDLGRYALPLAPIALLGFSDVYKHKSAKWFLLLLLPIYLLGWQFVVANVQSIADWSPLL